MILRKKVLIGLIFGAGALFGFLLWDALTVSEEEQVKAFVRQLAAELPTREAEGYLDYVDLSAFGFRLSHMGNKQAFGAEDQEEFLKIARSLAGQIRGSKVSVRSVQVELNKPIAKVKLTVLWERGEAKEALFERALVGLDGTLARKDETAWMVTSLEAYPARDWLGAGFGK